MRNVVLVVGSLILFAPFGIAKGEIFTGLGDLPGGVYRSVGFAISPNGSQVAGQGVSSGGLEAFRWTATNGMIGLGDLSGGSHNGIGYGISDNGVIVGSGHSAIGEESVRWTATDGLVSLGDFSGGTVFSAAKAVSADGSIIVGYGLDDGGALAYRWTSTTGLVSLGRGVNSDDSYAFGVSSDGKVIVGFNTGSWGSEAFRWTEDVGMEGLGDLPGGAMGSIATSASANGDVVVGYDQNSFETEAFRWTRSGGMVGLGDLDGGIVGSWGYGVSADGSVIVGTSHNGQLAAFIWDETHGMRDLKSVLTSYGVDLSDWRLESANSVSADGMKIVGYGYHSDHYEAFLVDLTAVPETSSLLLTATAIGAGWFTCRRRTRSPSKRQFGSQWSTSAMTANSGS